MVFITFQARVTFGISVLIALSSFSYGQIGKGDVLIDELHALGNIDLLPAYIKGSEVAMLSSYDRTGGNDDGFSGKYSYIRKEGENRLVMADLKGPGVIERIWTPVPTSDTIEFYFDGEKTPGIKMPFEDLFSSPGKFPFQAPLVGNEVGGGYNYVPIPYKKSCKIVYIGNGLKFHQIQFRTFTDKRKAPVGEWIDISSGEIQFVKKEKMGVIEIKNGRAALTFRAKGQKGKCDFSLHKIYLKKELINKK